jgi:hypothetical protein
LRLDVGMTIRSSGSARTSRNLSRRGKPRLRERILIVAAGPCSPRPSLSPHMALAIVIASLSLLAAMIGGVGLAVRSLRSNRPLERGG